LSFVSVLCRRAAGGDFRERWIEAQESIKHFRIDHEAAVEGVAAQRVGDEDYIPLNRPAKLRLTSSFSGWQRTLTFCLPAPEIRVSMLWHPRLDGDVAHRWLRSLVLEACTASG
jgi:hypothetical protein